MLPLSRRRPSPPYGADAVTRICVVAPSLGILGGQAVQALRLVEHLNDSGAVQVDLLPVNPVLPGPLRLLQSIKYVRTIVTSLRYASSLLRRLPRYDVIHVFSASYWSFVLAPLPAMIVGRLYGKRVILNYHSGHAEDHFSRWPSAVRATRLAHDVIVPSDYLVDVLARFGIRSRAIVNFVDVDRIPHRRRSAFRPKFLTNRNLEPLYNVALVLHAFARIQRERPDASLVVAGFGSQRAALEALVHELQLRNVTFVGRVAADQMGRLYDDADLFLNGSDIDNMPLSILDAFAAGTPVVTTDAGGIPYLVKDGRTGIVVRRGDDAALAEGALRLLQDAELAARIGDSARAECISRYTWRAVCTQWLDLYAGPRHAALPPVGTQTARTE